MLQLSLVSSNSKHLAIFKVGYDLRESMNSNQTRSPYYGVPSVIAVNMILAGASGGIVAIIIATWAQVNLTHTFCNLHLIIEFLF